MRLRSFLAVAVVTAALGSLAAVGLAATAAVPPYQGPEENLPTSYPIPKLIKGAKCTIGFLNPLGANESLANLQKAIEIRASQLKCKLIALDDQLKVDKQVTDFDQLLAQNVNAIIYYPIDPRATEPSLKKAYAAHIPVLAIEKTLTAPDKGPYLASQVWQARDHQAYFDASQVAKAKPGAKVVIIGIGAPVPALKYWAARAKAWAQKFGLTVLGGADNPTDDAAGGEKAMSGLLGRFPTIDAVIAYNDPSALGACAAAKANSRTILCTGQNGGSDGIEGVKKGRLLSTLLIDNVGEAVQLVNGAYDLLTHQVKSLPKVIISPIVPITKANVNGFKTVPERIADLKKGIMPK
jgi:ribose transport system substrate-binding protein